MITKKINKLLSFAEVSKLNASSGTEKGKYPFYSSSSVLSKRTDNPQYKEESIIIGTGGTANIHYSDIPFSTTSHCCVLHKKSDEVNIKYVYYYLLCNIYILEKGFKGVGLKNLSKTYIGNINISFPNLETQNKIITVLDRIHSLILQRKETIQILGELKDAIFWNMFGDPKTNTKNWNKKPLGSYISFMTSGSRGWAKYYTNNESSLFLRINNLGNNELKFDDIIFVNEPNNAESHRTKVQPKDVLLSITADIGRTAVIPHNFPKAFINQHICLLRLNEEINPYFLSSYLSSNGGKVLFKTYDAGVAKAGLNFNNIRSVEIFDIPIELQNEYEIIYHKIDSYKEYLLISSDLLENLFGSVSQKAFKGELLFDISIELDSMIDQIDLNRDDNDISVFSKDIVYLQNLVDKIQEQDFSTIAQYEKAKYILFRLLKNEEINQKYDKENKKIVLSP